MSAVEWSKGAREGAAQETVVAAGALNDVIAVVRSRPLSIEDAWAVLAAALPGVVRAERAAALREAAEAWTQGAWADTPRHARPIADRIAAAQYAGDWLRGRADRIERGES